MPIHGVSDARILPRLGIIRLGVKLERAGKTPIPRATDYFVVPHEIEQYVGEQPRELAIMFPSDDMEQIARQYLRCYGQTHGLVCWGDGQKSRWKVDVRTGAMADRDTRDWEWRDGVCAHEECPEYGARCRPVMNLMFMMPEVPGLGVWQLNTSSFYSIREINSTIALIRGFTRTQDMPEGRIAYIPLTLAIGPLEVSPPGTGKKTIHILHLKTGVKLADVIRRSLLPPAQVVMPEPVVEEAPEDLTTPEVVALEEGKEEQERAPPPEEDLFGLEQERQEEWQKVRKLMAGCRMNEKTARSFFAQVCDVSVPLEKLASETAPSTLTVHHLSQFRERLEKSRMDL